MFGALTERLQGLVKRLSSGKKLTEENISSAVREVRLALLDADVNYGVVKKLIQRVREKALGQAATRSVSPGDQFIRIVHEELVTLMGESEKVLTLRGDLPVIMLCGLQGAGKTTHCAKLAHYIKKQGIRSTPLLVACDRQRPAAIDQLRLLSERIGVDCFTCGGEKDPLRVARLAEEHGRRGPYDLLIVDTAGRLHLDAPLMEELAALQKFLDPDETFFVANATTGQDAAKSAQAIDERISLTGVILTMCDGDARAGAALSIYEVTGKPLRFEGVGEKPEDLQLFNPRSMADRVLGMGDVVNLVRLAEEAVDTQEAEALEKKLRRATFTFEDYLSQMRAVKKIGSFQKILKMLPIQGMNPEVLARSEEEFGKAEAIILSMTLAERLGQAELTMGRRRRLARGSGRSLDEVHRLLKGFRQAKQMMKRAPGKLKGLEKKFGMREGDPTAPFSSLRKR